MRQDKSCTSPLAQRKRKRNRFPFTAIFKLHICHGKDITKTAKPLSSKPPLPPAFPPNTQNAVTLLLPIFRQQQLSRGLILPLPNHSEGPRAGGQSRTLVASADSSAAATRQRAWPPREEPEAGLQSSLPPGCGRCRAGCGTAGRCHSHLRLGC